MQLTLKRAKIPVTPNVLEEFLVLDDEGQEVARLYKRQTSKTGFKNGRTVGQVKVNGWYFRLTPSHPYDEFGKSEGMAGGPKWTKRTEALEALTGELRDRAVALR